MLSLHTHGGKAISRVVGQLDGFAGRAESHRGEHRAENFLLRNDRSGMDIAQQRWRKIKPPRRHRDLRLPAGCAFGNALIHQSLNALQLHARHNGADVDGFVQRRSYPQRAHAIANLGDQRFGNALLHQQPRTRAANLPLIQPDPVDQTFDGAVEIGILENNEWRFAAQLQRKPLMALTRSRCESRGRLRWIR